MPAQGVQDGGGLHVRALYSGATSQSKTLLRLREEPKFEQFVAQRGQSQCHSGARVDTTYKRTSIIVP